MRPIVEPLEDRWVLTTSDWMGPTVAIVPPDPTVAAQLADDAIPLDLNAQTAPTTVPAQDTVVYQVTVDQSGNLDASLDSGGLTLTLYDAQGALIVRSDGASASNPAPEITQGLGGDPAGTVYYLVVSNPTDAPVDFTLTDEFVASSSNLQTVSGIPGASVMVAGDFNGDGALDLVTGFQLNLLVGNGDGTFHNTGGVSQVASVEAVVAGDFDGDGDTDLASNAYGTDQFQVLLNNGDGTFATAPSPSDVPMGSQLLAGDFNGDGLLDLVSANAATDSVVVCYGDGLGGFHAGASLTGVDGPSAVTASDFNGDGVLDLAVASSITDDISIFLNQGNDTFVLASSFVVNGDTLSLQSADFNGDGKADLAAANFDTDTVSVYLGDGAAAFQLAGGFATGQNPIAIAVNDFNGDGQLDLAVASSLANDVTLLVNDGVGGFSAIEPLTVGRRPFALVSGDFNNDGSADLASANVDTNDATILLGNGDGTFPQPPASNSAGIYPTAIVTADFDADGRLDLAVGNLFDGTATILMGNNDGTFRTTGTYSVPGLTSTLAVGDFNGDGRDDLLIAASDVDNNNFTVTLLLGDGAGGFVPSTQVTLAGQPSSVVVGDFNSDGVLDFAVAIEVYGIFDLSNEVDIFLGDGRGHFTSGDVLAAGGMPNVMVAGDFNGDGHLDLATGNYYSGDVSVLVGDGAGHFGAAVSYPLYSPVLALTAADFNGDGFDDLAATTFPQFPNSVFILLNDGAGAFTPGPAYDLGASTPALVAGDFNGDGITDLVASQVYAAYTYSFANSVTVLLGQGDGSFQPTGTFPTDIGPKAMVVGDINGDGQLDLATANFFSADVSVLLGTGDGSFVSPVLAPTAVESTPLVASLFSNGTSDVIVLSQSGEIVVRRGKPESPGTFASPEVVNPDPEAAARDVALVSTSDGTLIAALDKDLTALPNGTRVAQVTLYQPMPNGSFGRVGEVLLPGVLPSQIAAGDVNGDGLDDLVISAAGSNQVFVALQTPAGDFGPVAAYTVGVNPTSIAIADMNGDSINDIVVADQYSGQVSILIADGSGQFAPEGRYRSGTGLSGQATLGGTQTVTTQEGTRGVVVGSFDDRPGTDVLAVNPGTSTIALLSGSGLGGVFNPDPSQIVFPGFAPSAAASADLNGDGILDIAALDPASGVVLIALGDGTGGFTPVATVDAGNDPTGISCADVTRPGGGGPDGVDDLLVGNSYGDLLILAGNGDGSFSPYRRADQAVSLTVAQSDAQGSRQATFYFSNQSADLLAFQAADAGTPRVENPTVYQDRTTGIIAPGQQSIVSVQGVQYLVVTNSGANSLLIYTLDANGQPILASEQRYFTGTDPEAFALTDASNDLNGDAIPDVVVANQGSNDLSVFVGAMVGGVWTLDYRPRQSTGNVTPTSVAIADVARADGTGGSDSLPDLLVGNSQTAAVTVLPNRGDAFFIANNPAAPVTLAAPLVVAPQLLYVGQFDDQPGADLVVVNSVDNKIQLVSNFVAAPTVTLFAFASTTASITVVPIEIDGKSSLLVANVNGGDIVHLVAADQGFVTAETIEQDQLAYVSDLAFLTTGDSFAIYGTDASHDVAVLLGAFGGRVQPPDPVPTPPDVGNQPTVPGGSSGFDSETETFASADELPIRAFSTSYLSGITPATFSASSANRSDALLAVLPSTLVNLGASLVRFFSEELLSSLTEDLFLAAPFAVFSEQDEDAAGEGAPPRMGVRRPPRTATSILLLNVIDPAPAVETPEPPLDMPDLEDADPKGASPRKSGLPAKLLALDVVFCELADARPTGSEQTLTPPAVASPAASPASAASASTARNGPPEAAAVLPRGANSLADAVTAALVFASLHFAVMMLRRISSLWQIVLSATHEPGEVEMAAAVMAQPELWAIVLPQPANGPALQRQSISPIAPTCSARIERGRRLFAVF